MYAFALYAFIVHADKTHINYTVVQYLHTYNITIELRLYKISLVTNITMANLNFCSAKVYLTNLWTAVLHYPMFSQHGKKLFFVELNNV